MLGVARVLVVDDDPDIRGFVGAVLMDGPSFARAYDALPVPPPHAGIIVTTAGRDAQRMCKELRAQGCLPKPFDLAKLVEEVETLLHGRAA